MARRVSVRAGFALDEGGGVSGAELLAFLEGAFVATLFITICYLIVFGTDRRRE
jgi:hypothetical protein